MKHFLYYALLGACVMAMLPSCETDEPDNLIKAREDRTVLVLTTEFSQEEQDLMTHVWLNGEIVVSYRDIQPGIVNICI